MDRLIAEGVGGGEAAGIRTSCILLCGKKWGGGSLALLLEFKACICSIVAEARIGSMSLACEEAI